MSRRFFLTLWLAATLLAACQPVATPPPAVATPAPTQIPTATAIPHADSIRLALVGGTTLTNVWAYFDEAGADYNNRAVQAEFWPSLFHLSPFTGAFEPYLAGTVTPLEPDSGFLASSVTLRANLFWSDGSPLTAEDVAFTVNTALQFHLGLDWAEAYNPDLLDHAEVLNPQTVRFYFRAQPAVKDWQYGALQGPIVNAAFWGPKVATAMPMLTPNPGLDSEILALQNERAQLERELNDLLSQLKVLDPTSAEYANLDVSIYEKQDELNSIDARIAEKQAAKEAVYAAARQGLYELSAQGEPTFGPFFPARRGADEFENIVNPHYPFDAPRFDRAVYRVYADKESAVRALYAGEVNVVLNPNGVNAEKIPNLTSAAAGVTPQMPQFARSNLRVLAFNVQNPFLGDYGFRQALACMASQHFFPSTFHYPDGLILSAREFGFAPGVKGPCEGMDEPSRLGEAVRVLEAAGYAWDVKPAWEGGIRAGSGLRRGEIKAPGLTLLVAREDAVRVAIASAIVDQLRILGVEASVEPSDAEDVLYRVYDSGQFEMVILGWRLGRFPSYLCDLFGPGNPFHYERPELSQRCAAFGSALDLNAAGEEASALQSLLMQDVPIVPLYSDVGYDLYAGVTYPFVGALDGVTGMYGAPWLAVPSP